MIQIINIIEDYNQRGIEGKVNLLKEYFDYSCNDDRVFLIKTMLNIALSTFEDISAEELEAIIGLAKNLRGINKIDNLREELSAKYKESDKKLQPKEPKIKLKGKKGSNELCWQIASSPAYTRFTANDFTGNIFLGHNAGTANNNVGYAVGENVGAVGANVPVENIVDPPYDEQIINHQDGTVTRIRRR